VTAVQAAAICPMLHLHLLLLPLLLLGLLW
jgi:hypothetical protein